MQDLLYFDAGQQRNVCFQEATCYLRDGILVHVDSSRKSSSHWGELPQKSEVCTWSNADSVDFDWPFFLFHQLQSSRKDFFNIASAAVWLCRKKKEQKVRGICGLGDGWQILDSLLQNSVDVRTLKDKRAIIMNEDYNEKHIR